MTNASTEQKQGALTLRDATQADDARITELTLAAYEQFSVTMPAEFWPRYHQALVASLEGESSAERIVAELDGVIVGSVYLYPPSSKAYSGASVSIQAPEIRLLAVAPEARGHGVGSALMDECLRRARAQGATAVGLHTMPVMEVALRMYRRMGFVPAPETDFTPMPGVVVEGFRRAL